MKNIIGFVGKPYPEFIRWIASQGYEVHAFVDNESSYSFPPEITKVFQLDFSSKENLFKELENISVQPLSFVCTYENAVVPKAWLGEYYQHPHLAEQSARLATDKAFMRAAFSRYCPQYSPGFASVENWTEIEAFMQQYDFPVILKPANLFKSLLVTKNTTLEELKENFILMSSNIQKIYEKEGVKFRPKIVIEEYLEGPSFSVEVFTDVQGNAVAVPEVVDLIMGRDLGIPDNYNFSRKLPSRFSRDLQNELRDAAIAGVKAMSLTSSPAHVELVLTANGPKIIEIGARTGGYRPRMFELAFGINLFAAQLESSFGKLPVLESKKHEYCAVYEFFSKVTGNFQEIENFSQVQNMPSYYYGSVKRKVGEVTGPAKDGYRAAALVILAHADEQQFLEDVKFVEDFVAVKVT